MHTTRTVAALYCLPDSRCIYRFLEGVEVWDEKRDARKFRDPMPVVAHPPCRTWGGMRQFSKGTDEEHALGFHAVALVHINGGVLEHPRGSKLFERLGLPKPGEQGTYGFTIEVDQYDFGHPCRKRTWLYIVGVRRENLPPMPGPREGKPEYVIAPSANQRRAGLGRGHYLPKSKRSVTPVALAEWLVAVARASTTGERSC